MEQTAVEPVSVVRVFVSHSSRDADAATALIAALEAQGLPCWVAPRNVPPGMRYGEAIIDGINACSLFVLLLSQHSNASPQVLAEVERAVSKGLTVITIRLEPVALTKSLEYFLSAFHWIDAFPLPIEPHLTRLVAAVTQSAAPSASPTGSSSAAARPSRERPNNLPHQLTSFIGRDDEVAGVAATLRTSRLLTLAGIGGTGKTRLSLQAAAGLLMEQDGFEDGVWFIELAPLSDAALVTQTVADVLSVREERGTALLKTLSAALREKRLLLILDNCEHVLSACAALASELLRACPGVRFLASSREPLGVPGEEVRQVPPLSLPDADRSFSAAAIFEYEAVRLFTARAQAARPDFAVTDANAFAVADVCRRLDGIPLALELAAARVRSLSVEEIDARLDNRFRLLTGGSKTLLPRQQTLRALIDWSYDLLTDQEQTLLCRLSVFAGGWTLSAAEEACSGEDIGDWEVLDLLTALVDKSLVVYAEAGGVGRYRLLETVRQYGRERLAESGMETVVRGRHRDVFAALAEAAKPHLVGPEQAAWLSRLDVEYDNLREALAWCDSESPQELTSDRADGWLGMCIVLRRFWDARGYFGEGRHWLGRALERTRSLPPSLKRARALSAAGWLARGQSDYTAARTLLESSLEEARQIANQDAIAAALNDLGVVAFEQGDFGAAQALYEESLAIHRKTGHRSNLAGALGNLGMLAVDQGDLGRALLLLEESLRIYREVGEEHSVAGSLISLGLIARNQNDLGKARSLLREALDINRQIEDKRGIAVAQLNLSSIARDEDCLEEARSLLEESLSIFRQGEDPRGVAFSLNGLGSVAYDQGKQSEAWALQEQGLEIFRQIGDQLGVVAALEGLAEAGLPDGGAELAARLWGAASALREKIGSPPNPQLRVRLEKQYAQVQAAIGEAAFASALATGASLTQEEAITEALKRQP